MRDEITDGARPADQGFSFIELLAYMAIAALLILAAIPQFNNYRAMARDHATVNDVRNVAVAYEAWPIDHPGEAFPLGQRGWDKLTAGAGVLEAMGVVLSQGTSIWAMDRVDKTLPPTSAVYIAPGLTFCVFAYNLDGAQYNSPDSPNYVRYYSGDGGLDTGVGKKSGPPGLTHCDGK